MQEMSACVCQVLQRAFFSEFLLSQSRIFQELFPKYLFSTLAFDTLF